MRFTTRIFWLALLVVSGVMLAGFVTSNQSLTTIHLWPATVMIRGELWIFVLSAFGLGMIIGASVFWLQNLGLKARLWSKAKKISELEAHIEETEQQLHDKNFSDGYNLQVGKTLSSK